MEQLQVGFGRVNITPMMGIDMVGYYSARHADGVLDDLELNAVALANGNVRGVLITMDSEGISRECVQAIRKYIAEATGLSGEELYIHATHIHTGPTLSCDSEDVLQREYFQFICRRMADVARMALEDLKPARVGWGIGTAPEIAFVRRYRMKDGSVQTNPGVNNPEIVEPVGVVDSRVNVLRFDRESGDHVVLVNYGNHPDVIGGCKISADWPGHVRRELERYIDDCKCVVFNGAQGDVNHIKVHQDRTWEDCLSDSGMWQGYGHSRYMGRALAGVVLQVYDKVKVEKSASLRFRQKTIRIPSNMPKPEDMPQAHYINELYKAGRSSELSYTGMMNTTVVAEAVRMVKLEHGPEYFEMELSAVAIGNIALIGIPGEPFTGIGMALKEAPGWDLVLPTCLTNGAQGYFPMRDAYDEGGYEARSSRFKPGVAELIIEEGKKLLAELKG